MTVAVVACAVALGWSVRLARSRSGRRPVRRAVPRRTVLPPWARSWAPRPRRSVVLVDPAPLLRFRTAIERGASVAQAFDAVASGSGRWAIGAGRLVRRVRAGSGVQAAVDTWVAEDPDPSLRLLADALAISAGTGGSHVRAVDAVIDAVRERAALQREVRALASQAQTSAAVLVLLPLGFAVAVMALDPRVRAFSFGSVPGLLCVLVGCGLDVVGGWLMLRLVRAVG